MTFFKDKAGDKMLSSKFITNPKILRSKQNNLTGWHGKILTQILQSPWSFSPTLTARCKEIEAAGTISVFHIAEIPFCYLLLFNMDVTNDILSKIQWNITSKAEQTYCYYIIFLPDV